MTEVIETKVTVTIEAENAVKAQRLFRNSKDNGSWDFSEESHIVVSEKPKYQSEVKNND